MQALLHQFQRRPKATISIVATATATTSLALLATPLGNSLRFPLSTMSANHPSEAASTPPQPKQWPTRKYTSPHASFPYTAADLTPMDASPDAEFYSSPRFVAHIDDHAIAALRQYYQHVLPSGSASPSSAATSTPPTPRPNILDLCSSWISHYPPSLEAASAAGQVSIAGIGMNDAELAANPLFQPPSTAPAAAARYLVRDLNADPTVPAFHEISQAPASHDRGAQQADAAAAAIDAATLAVSIDYLTSPVALLASLHARTRPGGTLHVAVSNRCFPTKAVRRWLRLSEEERLDMVAEMLVWSGWAHVEILCLSDGTGGAPGEESGEAADRGLFARALAGMGIGTGAGRVVDPLWVVRGKKG